MTLQLPNGNTIEAEVLTQEELNALLMVRTTVEQAQQILKRNTPMLKALKRWESYEGHIGCPHCIEVEDLVKAGKIAEYEVCDHCAWAKYPRENEEVEDVYCFEATFGGVKYVQALEVSYTTGTESLSVYEKCYIENCTKFIQGHLDWANAVIAIGGAPWKGE